MCGPGQQNLYLTQSRTGDKINKKHIFRKAYLFIKWSCKLDIGYRRKAFLKAIAVNYLIIIKTRKISRSTTLEPM